MGGNVLGDAGGAGVFLHDALDAARGEAAKIARSINGLKILAVIKKKWSERIGAGVEVVADAFGGGGGDENRTVLVALTADDKFAAVEIDRITVELDQLGNTQATREKQLDDGAVAETGFVIGRDGIEQVLDFIVMQKGHLFAYDVGEFYQGMIKGFDVAFGKVFEEAAERHKVISLSNSLEVFAVTVLFAVEGEAEFAHEVGGDIGWGEFVALPGNVAGEVEEAGQIARVVFGSFAGAPALDFEVLDKIVD